MSANNKFFSMQKGFLALMSAALLFSCSQIDPFEASDIVESQETIALNFKSIDPNARVGKDHLATACSAVTHPLMAGQHTPVGEVTVYNSNDKFYVTVSIEEGEGFDNGKWFIKKLQGYYGEVETDFVTKNKKGIRNPAPGKFPIQESIEIDFGKADQEYTFELELNDYLKGEGKTFDVAMFAEVVRVENLQEVDGVWVADVKQTEGAWAGDQRFNPEGLGNWSRYMSYTVKSCEVAVEDVCDAEWSRSFNLGGQQNREISYDDETLSVIYQVNDNEKGPVGTVEVTRTGERTPEGYTFTAEFFPNDDIVFEEIQIFVRSSESSNDTIESAIITDGNVVSVFGNQRYVRANPNTNSFVTVRAISNACAVRPDKK